MKNFFKNYIKDLKTALDNLDYQKIEEISNKLIEAKVNHNTVFLIGNGGSSATPSHSAGDWAKEVGIKSLCLTDNVSSVTAFANDTSYENIFRGQLEVFLEEGDVVIGYSGSGNSPNVINAIRYAKEKGNYTVGITGNYRNGNGGKLSELADISIVVITTSMERIEDIHLIINHIIKNYIIEKQKK